jgi:hypothetical protein
MLGKRVHFAPRAVARDARIVPDGEEFRRKVRTLTGNFQLCRIMPELLVPWRNPVWVQFVWHKLLRLLTPFLAIGILVSLFGLVASLLSPAAGLGLAMVLLAMGLWMASPSGPPSAVRSILMMLAAALVASWKAASSDWAVWHEPPAGPIRPGSEAGRA